MTSRAIHAFPLALWVLLAGCQTSSGSSGAAGSPPPDGGFGQMPKPTVVTDFDAPPSSGDAGDSGPRRTGVIPGVGGGNDANRPPPRWDASPDTGDAGAGACNVLRQDCPRGEGCYIAANGVPTCFKAGDFPENTVCDEQPQCAPGLICVEVNGGGAAGTCQRACDATLPGSCGAGSCLPLAWVTLGYCAP